MFIDPYLATIAIFAGNFAPRNWMFCNGQLLSIAEYNALFALIGTTYGGDGQVTFALPDLRSRVAIHEGQGPGLSNYSIGEMAGTENVTLLSTNLPMHNHSLVTLPIQQPASTVNNSGINEPKGAYPASGATVYSTTSDGSRMGPYTSTATTPVAGSNQPVSIIQPYLAMHYIIAVEGIFPSRA
ncbi:MAG: phage tail protein [Bacteroidota bacterium]|jgi:microcystin-dependent protein